MTLPGRRGHANRPDLPRDSTTSTPTVSSPGPRCSPQLRSIRSRLEDPATFAEAAAELGSRLARTRPVSSRRHHLRRPRASPPEDLLDQILHQSSSPPAAAPPPAQTGAWGAFLEQITAPISTARIHARPSSSRGVDAAMAQLLRDILHHPEFQALESLWRVDPSPDPPARDRRGSDPRADRPDPRRTRSRPALRPAPRQHRRLQAPRRAERGDRGGPALDIPGRRPHFRPVPARISACSGDWARSPGSPAPRSSGRQVPGS